MREMANTCECVAEVSTFCNTAIVMDREYSGFGHAAAVIGFEVQKVAIEGKIAEIRLMLDGGRSEPAIPS